MSWGMPMLYMPHTKYTLNIMSDGSVGVHCIGKDIVSDEDLAEIQRIMGAFSVMSRAYCVHGVKTSEPCVECAQQAKANL